MNLKEVEKVVAGIQSQLFKNSNSYAIGMLKSHFKGTGLQFKEHQVYVPGDDVRFMDWKLSAKTRTSYIKTFEEERNIEITVLLDITLSMFTGYKGVSKFQAAIELTCLLYLLAKETGDKVQVILWVDREVSLPLKSGKEGIVQLISALEKLGLINEDGRLNLEYEIKDDVSMSRKVAMIKSFLARNKEIVLFTDFSSMNDTKILNKLLYRKNLHCFQIQGPLDKMNRRPFSLVSFNSTDKSKDKIYTPKGSDFKEMRKEERLSGRVKILNVKEKYLNKFIEEMV